MTLFTLEKVIAAVLITRLSLACIIGFILLWFWLVLITWLVVIDGFSVEMRAG
jgi:hypothetical protein